MKTEIIIIVFLSLYAVIFSALQWKGSRIRKNELQIVKNDVYSFRAMAKLFRCLLEDRGDIDSYFEIIETKKFINDVQSILGDRFLKSFNELMINSNLPYVYKRGENWQSLKHYMIDKMDLETAKKLYLHYTALEINNLFKVGDQTPSNYIKIAKEISLAVIINAASKEKGEPALQEVAEQTIKEFDLGDNRKILLMAEVIKIEKGMPV